MTTTSANARRQAILTTILARTTDRDAAVDCTGVYFAGCYGARYDAARYTDGQLIDRILNDVAEMARQR